MKALMGDVVDIFSDQAHLAPKYNLPALAAWSAERLPEYPDIPTMKELGYDAVMGNWLAMYAPKGTPQNVKDKLTSALKATLEDQTSLKRLADLRLKPAWMGQDDLDKFGAVVFEQNRKLLEKANLIAK